jgi:hypothetical protein
MSFPIHHAKDLDASLRYAPRWAREQGQPIPVQPSVPPVEWPRWLRSRGNDRTFNGDRALLELQRQLARDPDGVPEPPTPPPFVGDPTVGRIVLRMCGVAGIAAVIAGAIVWLPAGRLLGHKTVQASFPVASITIEGDKPINGEKQDSLRTVTATRPERAGPEIGAEEKLRKPGEQATSSISAGPIVAGAAISERASPVISPEPLPTAQPLASSLIIRQIDRDEVRSLVTRGEAFITSGDLASARLVLRRAAEAGDVHAALALAGTFDPNLVGNGLADAAMARLWYVRAARLGSVEAPQRLQQLATQVDSVP